MFFRACVGVSRDPRYDGLSLHAVMSAAGAVPGWYRSISKDI